jgi:hypothetical protein
MALALLYSKSLLITNHQFVAFAGVERLSHELLGGV